MDGEAGWWTTSGNIGLPPLARVMGVGRPQQQSGVGCHIGGHFVGALAYADDVHWLRQVGQVYVLLSIFVNNLHLTMT